MKKEIKSLPDSELRVMKAIWKFKEPLSTGEIQKELKDETSWKLSTLQVILSRLVEKGFLETFKNGKFNYYKSLIQSNEYAKTETQNFIKKIYNNSAKTLIASLIEENNSLSKKDIEDIRNLLNKAGE